MSVPKSKSMSFPTNTTIKDIGNGTLVYEAKVDNLTTKKFWSLMWADNEFWNNTVTDLNMRLVTKSNFRAKSVSDTALKISIMEFEEAIHIL